MLLQEAQTDWLASKNIFYNTKSNQISDNVNDLMDCENIEFDWEGLYNYLDYGYCGFGQTPVKNIKILEPNRKIAIKGGKIKITELPDLFERDLCSPSNLNDTLDYLHYITNKRAEETDTDLIVPTSGGFDSRLINCMIEDKKRIHAFTWGTSENQQESFEVVYARKLCELLHINWEQIELNRYNDLIGEWFQIFGIAAHAHGMYQMEFYQKMLTKIPQKGLVLSGIYGDLWAGNWRFPDVLQSKDLIEFSIHHGMRLDMSYSRIKCSHELRDAAFEKMRDKLKNDSWRIVFAARMKIVLLSYLLRIPEYYGFQVWSPFLDYGAVVRMINLDWKEKEKRKWQVDYFRQKGVLIGEWKLSCDTSNCLDYIVAKNTRFQPLNVKLLSQIVKTEYLEYINRSLRNLSKDKMNCYYSYMVLYPVQKLLELKESAYTGDMKKRS